MERWRSLSAGLILALMPLAIFLGLTAAAPPDLQPGGLVLPKWSGCR